MGKASKWFAKMATCIFGFKKLKNNSKNSSGADQIPASNHHQLVRYKLHKSQAREVAAAIAAAESAAASISEAALAIARARVSFRKGGGGEKLTANAAAVKIQKSFRGYLVRIRLNHQIGADKIPITGELEKKHAAALKIQKVYRGHLARRALRALRSLVKVQAMFRGRRVRKRVAAVCIEALIRARKNAPAPAEYVCRSPNYMSPTMSSKAKFRAAVKSKKEEGPPGTGERMEQYFLFVDKMASRFSFSDGDDGSIHFRDEMMDSRPSFSEVRLHNRSRSQVWLD